jgi:hypothetical protein
VLRGNRVIGTAFLTAEPADVFHEIPLGSLNRPGIATLREGLDSTSRR